MNAWTVYRNRMTETTTAFLRSLDVRKSLGGWTAGIQLGQAYVKWESKVSEEDARFGLFQHLVDTEGFDVN